MKITKDLTKGNIYVNFFLYAIPLIFASLLSQAYDVIDGVIAGKFIGDYALGAVGATSSFDTMLNTMFSGFAVGFSVYVARLFGQKDYARMKMDIINVLCFLTIIIVATGLLCIVFRQPLFRFLKVSDTIKEDALLYFTICKAGYLVIIINSVFVQILNSLGITSFSFYASLLSAVLNIGGNLLSVTVFDLGIAGLAVSSVVSSAIVSLCYVWKLRQTFRELSSPKLPFRFCFTSVRNSLRYSLTACLQQATMYFAGLMIAPSVNAMGAAATTGYAVINRFYNICAQSYQNSSKAVSSYTAQSIGAKKYAQIRKGIFVGLLQGTLLLAPFVLVLSLFATPIASVFFSDGYSGEALDYAVTFASSFLPFIFINLINNLTHSFLRGMGAMKTLVFSTLIGCLSRITATLILVPSMQMEGVFTGWIISWLIEAVFCFCIFCFRYRTVNMIARRAEESVIK